MRSDAINLMGETFGELTVIGRDDNTGKWVCRCSCGNIRNVRSYDLRKGTARTCLQCYSKIKSDSKRIDLTGQTFGKWQVIKYTGNKKYLCRCSCGYEGEVFAYNLTKGTSKSCEKCSQIAKIQDLTGKHFGNLVALKYVGSSTWKCRCDCGRFLDVSTYKLNSGETTACDYCSHNKNLIDLTGIQFGDWTVLEYVGELRWKCRCSCGAVSNVLGYNLRSGHSKSCGHDQLIDLTGKKINEWTVLKYLGNYKWLCKCSCGNIRSIHGYELRTGKAKSCGCKKWEYTKHTMLEKYGEISPLKINNTRTYEQIQAVESAENLKDFIIKLGNKPTSYELADKLGMQIHRTLIYVHKYNLDNFVNLMPSISRQETEIYKFAKAICTNIVCPDRKILKGKELDLYFPDHKLAIEFNGTYWHSSALKDKYYHQNKTIECVKQGIRLIHIFEYEWEDPITQEKIKNLLKSALNNQSNIVYAKNTEIRHIDKQDSDVFLENYHLQGSASSSIRLGIFSNAELLGVMTLGKPRFNQDFEYELIRLAWRPDINVVGGFEKLFKYFINEYNPNSIVSYCDIAKFTGDSYLRVGFKATKKDITDPNYVWVRPYDNDILNRYQTQKNKLIQEGFGDYGNTEDEIMDNLGYLKIYNSGNLRFRWIKS